MDSSYKFQEMHESMLASIENAKKVKAQQEELIDIIEFSDKKEDFEEFIEESKKQIENLNGQIERLTERANLLEDLNKKVAENAEVKEVVNNIIVIFNMFGEN